jgi:hypothetical protein
MDFFNFIVCTSLTLGLAWRKRMNLIQLGVDQDHAYAWSRTRNALHLRKKNNKKSVIKRGLGNCPDSYFEHNYYFEATKTARVSIINRCLHRT